MSKPLSLLPPSVPCLPPFSASLLICQVMLQQNQVPDSGLLELEVGAIGL